MENPEKEMNMPTSFLEVEKQDKMDLNEVNTFSFQTDPRVSVESEPQLDLADKILGNFETDISSLKQELKMKDVELQKILTLLCAHKNEQYEQEITKILSYYEDQMEQLRKKINDQSLEIKEYRTSAEQHFKKIELLEAENKMLKQDKTMLQRQINMFIMKQSNSSQGKRNRSESHYNTTIIPEENEGNSVDDDKESDGPRKRPGNRKHRNESFEDDDDAKNDEHSKAYKKVKEDLDREKIKKESVLGLCRIFAFRDDVQAKELAKIIIDIHCETNQKEAASTLSHSTSMSSELPNNIIINSKDQLMKDITEIKKMVTKIHQNVAIQTAKTNQMEEWRHNKFNEGGESEFSSNNFIKRAVLNSNSLMWTIKNNETPAIPGQGGFSTMVPPSPKGTKKM